jgi:carbon-monoxide dehydrogenase large subunit
MSATRPVEASSPKLVGARIKRVEDARYLTGRARYVDDVTLSGTLEVAFLRSPVAHADLARLDTAHAAAHPGVRMVATGADLAGRVQPIVCDWQGPDWQGTRYPALAADRVRFVGEAVAAVVADSRYVAEDALELIDAEYREREVLATVDAAMADGAPLMHDGWEHNCFTRRHFVGGDPESAFAEADGVVEREVVTNRQTGMPIETRATLADFNAADGTLTIWTTTQIPHIMRTGIADCLGIAEHLVRVVSPDVGGGFGIKAHLYPEDLVVAHLAMRLGRPVKWLEDRREHVLAAIHAREHRHRIAAAHTADGVILAIRAEMYVDSGAYSIYPYTAAMEPGMAMGVLPGPYAIRNYECRAYAVATNKSPLGPYRGVARPAACFSMERIVDAVAEATGIDPLEVRRRNMLARDRFPYTTVTDLVYDSGDFVATIDAACEAVGYAELREEQERLRAEGRCVGIGIACYVEQTAHATAEFVKRGSPIIFGYDSSRVRMDPAGRLVVQVTSHSHGQGHETTMAQIVADVFGVAIEDVVVKYGDTSLIPYGTGTLGSRSIVMAGGAAQLAAERVRDKLKDFAAHLMEASPHDLELVDGRVGVKGSSAKAIEIRDLARWAHHRPEKLPEGMEPTLEATAVYDAAPGTGAFSNAAHVAVVEVEPANGRVKLLRYVVAEDCGTVVNPTIVEGQVAGGVVQGIGGALLEEIVYDDQAQPLTTSFMDYLLPTASDVPPVEVVHLETPSPITVGGIKGMGEGGAIAPGPAVAGAVEDALRPLGAGFVGELPITPQRVWSLIEGARAR